MRRKKTIRRRTTRESLLIRRRKRSPKGKLALSSEKSGKSEKGDKDKSVLDEPLPFLPPVQERACVLHNDGLMYFCDTCEEPVCKLCISIGPHNNQVKGFDRAP